MPKNSRPEAKGLDGTTKAVLIAVLLVVVVTPLAVNGGATFAGTDDAARTAITQIAPQVQPWFTPIWSPPSHNVESLLFSLQAGAGAGVIGYFFGLRRGRADRRPQSGNDRREGDE